MAYDYVPTDARDLAKNRALKKSADASGELLMNTWCFGSSANQT